MVWRIIWSAIGIWAVTLSIWFGVKMRQPQPLSSAPAILGKATAINESAMRDQWDVAEAFALIVVDANCPACRVNARALPRATFMIRGKRVPTKLLILNPRTEATQFARLAGAPSIPTYADTSGKISDALRVRLVPMAIVFGRNGIVQEIIAPFSAHVSTTLAEVDLNHPQWR